MLVFQLGNLRNFVSEYKDVHDGSHASCVGCHFHIVCIHRFSQDLQVGTWALQFHASCFLIQTAFMELGKHLKFFIMHTCRKKFWKAASLFIVLLSMNVFSSCSYDEEDATIIAYLRINDLLESKLSKTLDTDVERFIQKASLDEFSYAHDAYESFVNKYNVQGHDYYNIAELETDITSELWNYLNLSYSDKIPSKAQNIEEGRYYTISELKEKYPDYKNVELEEFRPMELVNEVMQEKLFDISMISNGDVNLRTLYVFYLISKNKQIEESTSSKSPVQPQPAIDYKHIIASHFEDGVIDSDVNVDEVIALFHSLSSGNNPSYTNDTKGFEEFATEYFETDMFSGADIEADE